MAITSRAAQRDFSAAAARSGGLLVTDGACPAAVRDAYAQTLLNVRYALLNAAGNSALVCAVDATASAAPLAANLAILAAQSGERVALVDTDAHQPTLDRLFALGEGPGFTTLIRQDGANPAASLQATDVPNLFVLGAEAGRAVPGGLGRAAGLAEALLRLKNQCDRLFVIGAPILSQVDSMDLSRHVDGVVVCLNPGKTHREDAANARELLARVQAPLLGVVVTEQP